MKTEKQRNGALDGVVRGLRALLAAESADELSDHELVERFVSHRDEAAFAALVLRHGPLTLGVCQRVLQNAHDAEDACQAAFLVLARKAGSIRKKDSLSSWLHGVAYRVASNLKKKLARRRAHEGVLLDESSTAGNDASWRDVKVVLDEELHRLPEHFRSPLLLCYLEGKTRDEAAQELGWSVATLRGRLERGRQLLGSRLVRRGVTLTASMLAVLLGQHAASAGLPATLVVETVKAAVLTVSGQAAAGLISTHVAAMANGVVRSMWITKLKLVAVVIVLAGAGLGVIGLRLALSEQRGNAAEVRAQNNLESIPAAEQKKEALEPAPEIKNAHEPPETIQGKRLHGVLKWVHPTHHTLTLSVKDHGHDVAQSYGLTHDTRVVWNGKAGQIDMLKAGMVADLILSANEKSVAQITILHKK